MASFIPTGMHRSGGRRPHRPTAKNYFHFLKTISSIRAGGRLSGRGGRNAPLSRHMVVIIVFIMGGGLWQRDHTHKVSIVSSGKTTLELIKPTDPQKKMLAAFDFSLASVSGDQYVTRRWHSRFDHRKSIKGAGDDKLCVCVGRIGGQIPGKSISN